MKTLLDKSMAQTDEVIGMAQRFSDEIGRLEAERDRLKKEIEYFEAMRDGIGERVNDYEDRINLLRSINRELVEALKSISGWVKKDLAERHIPYCFEKIEIVLAKAEKTA